MACEVLHGSWRASWIGTNYAYESWVSIETTTIRVVLHGPWNQSWSSTMFRVLEGQVHGWVYSPWCPPWPINPSVDFSPFFLFLQFTSTVPFMAHGELHGSSNLPMKPIWCKKLRFSENLLLNYDFWLFNFRDLTEDEVDRMNISKNLQYAVVGKFSYGYQEIDELRIQIPKQCNVKGECKICLLRNRHILMRFSRQ